jgi:hypothetical protein
VTRGEVTHGQVSSKTKTIDSYHRFHYCLSLSAPKSTLALCGQYYLPAYPQSVVYLSLVLDAFITLTAIAISEGGLLGTNLGLIKQLEGWGYAVLAALAKAAFLRVDKKGRALISPSLLPRWCRRAGAANRCVSPCDAKRPAAGGCRSGAYTGRKP